MGITKHALHVQNHGFLFCVTSFNYWKVKLFRGISFYNVSQFSLTD